MVSNLFLFIVIFNKSTDCWEDARVPSLSRPDGKFGDYNCDSSYELISSVLQFMKAKMGDNIDFILWTGYVLLSTYFLRISTLLDTLHIIMITMIIMQHLTSYTKPSFKDISKLDIKILFTKARVFFRPIVVVGVVYPS